MKKLFFIKISPRWFAFYATFHVDMRHATAINERWFVVLWFFSLLVCKSLLQPPQTMYFSSSKHHTNPHQQQADVEKLKKGILQPVWEPTNSIFNYSYSISIPKQCNLTDVPHDKIVSYKSWASLAICKCWRRTNIMNLRNYNDITSLPRSRDPSVSR